MTDAEQSVTVISDEESSIFSTSLDGLFKLDSNSQTKENSGLLNRSGMKNDLADRRRRRR